MPQTTIPSYYEADHDRLDGLFKTFQNLKRTDPERYATCCGKYHQVPPGAWHYMVVFTSRLGKFIEIKTLDR